jgi:Fic family protein
MLKHTQKELWVITSISFEKYSWNSRYSKHDLPRNKEEYLIDEYMAALPIKIANMKFELSQDLSTEIEDITRLITRLDERVRYKNYNIPAIMLRSESASSSQIEQLTASAKNVALAQIDNEAPQNSKIIAANIDAMHRALSIPNTISIDSIRQIHKSLLENTAIDIAGNIRNEQVWIGGTNISPHKALFVPPHHSRVVEYLDDFVQFCSRVDLNPILLAAISHAQFETIHPFIDGNGRTGRALLQKTLKDHGVLQNTALPISLGLLNQIEKYYSSLSAYQNGDLSQIVEILAESALFALNISKELIICIDNILSMWLEKISARKDSTIWKVLDLLVENPVVDAGFLQKKLNITEKSAYNTIETALKFNILFSIGKKGGSEKFMAKELIDLVESVTNQKGTFRRLN